MTEGSAVGPAAARWYARVFGTFAEWRRLQCQGPPCVDERLDAELVDNLDVSATDNATPLATEYGICAVKAHSPEISGAGSSIS